MNTAMREIEQMAAAARTEAKEKRAHPEADLLRARKRLDECLSAEDYAGAAEANTAIVTLTRAEPGVLRAEVGRQRAAKLRRAQDELSKCLTKEDYLGQQLHKQLPRRVPWRRARGWEQLAVQMPHCARPRGSLPSRPSMQHRHVLARPPD